LPLSKVIDMVAEPFFLFFLKDAQETLFVDIEDDVKSLPENKSKAVDAIR